jgi:rhodanese-related sulfurtransferase
MSSNISWALGAALVLLLLVGFWQQSQQGGKKMNISVQALKQEIATNPAIHIVDVREPAEIQQTGKVAQAVNIPLGTLAQNLPNWDKAEPVYVICRSGMRSQSGQQILSKAGFKAINVNGGTSAWMNAGFETKK